MDDTRSTEPCSQYEDTAQGSSLSVAMNRAFRDVLNDPQIRHKCPDHIYLSAGTDGWEPLDIFGDIVRGRSQAANKVEQRIGLKKWGEAGPPQKPRQAEIGSACELLVLSISSGRDQDRPDNRQLVAIAHQFTW